VSRSDAKPKMLAGVAVAVLALVAAIGWLELVSPERSKASDLNQRIAAAKTTLAAAQSTRPANPAVEKQKRLRAATTTKALTVGLPDDIEMPSLLRQVQKVAQETRVSLTSFKPNAAVPGTGYQAIPVDITVTGHFLGIQRFVRVLRTQAGVNDGHVHAQGRLFGIETLALAPSSTTTTTTPTAAKGSPTLTATIRVDGYIYGAPPAPTTTTDTTTTDTSASSAVGSTTATGGTPG
jgi:Tfp pilus assembly protein PilO